VDGGGPVWSGSVPWSVSRPASTSSLMTRRTTVADAPLRSWRSPDGKRIVGDGGADVVGADSAPRTRWLRGGGAAAGAAAAAGDAAESRAPQHSRGDAFGDERLDTNAGSVGPGFGVLDERGDQHAARLATRGGVPADGGVGDRRPDVGCRPGSRTPRRRCRVAHLHRAGHPHGTRDVLARHPRRPVVHHAHRPRVRQQAEGRVPDLVPIRYGRMLVSPFTFYRGVANIMAPDLATTPASGLRVQLCGDAHLSNFGGFRSPDRELVFDINDRAVGRAVAIAECRDRASNRRRIVPRRSNTSGALTAESIKTG